MATSHPLAFVATKLNCSDSAGDFNKRKNPPHRQDISFPIILGRLLGPPKRRGRAKRFYRPDISGHLSRSEAKLLSRPTGAYM